MPIKIEYTSEENISKIPNPNGNFVSHKALIDKTKDELIKNGFTITEAFYRSNTSGSIVNATYHISHGNDPDMNLMFAWTNSYDRNHKFKCAVGGYIFLCLNGMILSDTVNRSRRQKGKPAQDEAFESIEDHIVNAKNDFDILLKHKESLKKIKLTKRVQSNILGRLFAEEEILTLTQVATVKREMDDPEHIYVSPDTAWDFYNYITYALKESHPTSWLTDHSRIHDFFVNEYNLNNTGSGTKTPETIIEEIERSHKTVNLERPSIDSETEEVIPVRKSGVIFV
jgi:hypothetical protein